MRLHDYIEQQEIQETAQGLLEFAIFLDNFERLDEGFVDTVSGIKDKAEQLFKAMGFHASQGKGIVQYLWAINKNLLLLLYWSTVQSTGSEKEKEEASEKIKDIIHSVTKEDVVNFLYKLDAVSLGIITTPLKMLDAVTGWHIAGEVSTRIAPAVEKARKAIDWLEQAKETLTDKMKVQMEKYVNALRRVFGFEDFHKLKEA